MKYPSRASEDLGAIDFADDQDIYACVEEVMMIDEEARFEELPMDEPSLELKTLLSTLKYAFLDEEKAKLVIIGNFGSSRIKSWCQDSVKVITPLLLCVPPNPQLISSSSCITAETFNIYIMSEAYSGVDGLPHVQ